MIGVSSRTAWTYVTEVLLEKVVDALVLSLIAGTGATTLGALPAIWVQEVSPRVRAGLDGFSGGVMLAATFFSLLQPGLEMAAERVGPAAGVAQSAAGFVGGAMFVGLLHHFAPHEHFLKGVEGPARITLARTWLFVIAITLHNVPEGLATGVGAASGQTSLALPIATGIGLQNMPEGFIVAASLVRERYSIRHAIGIAFLTGAVEPVGAVLGAGALAISSALLPVALCFAAGAMVFVVSDEVLPESHRTGHSGASTAGVITGFVIMMVLDTLFA